jgi:ankyrin repeat protein
MIKRSWQCGIWFAERVNAFVCTSTSVSFFYCNQHGITALLEASRWGRTAVVKALIKAGADINAPNTVSVEYCAYMQCVLCSVLSWQDRCVLWTVAVCYCVGSSGIELVINFMLNFKDGVTALMNASRWLHTAAVVALITAGADLNAQDNVRTTQC